MATRPQKSKQGPPVPEDELQRLIDEQRRDDGADRDEHRGGGDSQRDRGGGGKRPKSAARAEWNDEHHDGGDEDSEDDSGRTEVEEAFVEAAVPPARPTAGHRPADDNQHSEEYGTARAGRQALHRRQFRRHLERLTIIDPVASNIAAMRLLHPRPLQIREIAELIGRGESTVEDALHATFARTLLLKRFPIPAPVATYALARKAGLSPKAAGFAFWFGYTLSAERAAELSGYGVKGPTAARKYVVKRLAEANDSRLHAWGRLLSKIVVELAAIPKPRPKKNSAEPKNKGEKARRLATTTLGKRRNDLHAKPRPKSMAHVAPPIPWLDPSPTGMDAPAETVEQEIPAVSADQMKLYILVARRERLDGDAVELLRDTLETRPGEAITTALELVTRDMPYDDAFRPPPTKRRLRKRPRSRK